MRLYERFADKGYHSSIATTFGIDFDAYENIVLPRVRGAGCRNNMVVADGRMITHALGGASLLPRQAGKLYTTAGATTQRLFHPKLFLQVGRKGGRLIIGSANLTAAGLAGNLELVALLNCGAEQDGEQALIAQAWEYLRGFIDESDPMLPMQQEWMLNRSAWLRSATPAEGLVTLADGTKAALLLARPNSGIGPRYTALIDEAVKRLIVVSPYWDEQLTALSFLADRLAPKEIAVLIDPETELFPRDAVDKLPNLKLYRRDGFEGGRFIHAKALVAETDSADHLLIGSANCTLAALGTAGVGGHNEEASLYRRLPSRGTARALGLEKILQDERRVEPEDLPELHYEDALELEGLFHRRTGTFSLHGDTLSWRPAAHISDPENREIELLNVSGSAIGASPSRLHDNGSGKLRYHVDATDDIPAFARFVEAEGFAPAIITHIDVLQASIRETYSRRTENVLAQLDGETEASLALLEILDVLEKIEDTDAEASGEGVSIPKAQEPADDGAANSHRKLSYEDFIAGRRRHQSGAVLHTSLGGSDVSIVRGFLNRIVGLSALLAAEEEDEEALKAAFDLGDETGDAEAAMAAGEDFELKRKPELRHEPDEEERRRRAKQRKATMDQLVSAANNFSKRIDLKQEQDQLSPRDFLRLRALLMIICAAGWKGKDNEKDKQEGRTSLQVLPVEADPNSWPLVIGRLLFKIFGGRTPVVYRLKLDTDHDQLPADLIECWATCLWCLQACLAAPMSGAERQKIARHIAPLLEQTYRRTHLSEEEFLALSFTQVMEGLSAQYAERLGVDPEALMRRHRTICRKIFSVESENS
ncbi:MAG TPA: hypothetical protein VK181_04000 [Rhizobium sp.]|nr:hypothetical protein [Rhizobium sp.]